MPIQAGADAPPISSAELGPGPTVVAFYKVTCPTCQVAAPAMERLHREAPGRLVAVVQDPPERAEEFGSTYGTTFTSVADTEPYEVSDAYAVRTVPTLFLVDEGRVAEVVESWDRDAWNGLAARMGDLLGTPVGPLSEAGDGLPPFKPG